MSNETPDTGTSKSVLQKRRAQLSYKLLLTICMASLIISTVASYFFFSKWSETADRNGTLMTEKNTLFHDFNVLKNSFDKQFNELSIIRDEQARVVALRSADSTKHSLARIYWNPSSQKTFIDVITLPEPGSGREYRLWAFYEGQYQDAGVVIFGSEAEIQQMKQVVNAESWFVTLGAKGEITTPSIRNVWLTMQKQ